MGKKMKNAPVYYAIAQARHNPVLRLSAYVPEIQDRLRKAGYPDHRPTTTLVVTLALSNSDVQPDAKQPVPKAVERHLFLSGDSTRGFIGEEGALSCQTTEYDTCEAFRDGF